MSWTQFLEKRLGEKAAKAANELKREYTQLNIVPGPTWTKVELATLGKDLGCTDSQDSLDEKIQRNLQLAFGGLSAEISKEDWKERTGIIVSRTSIYATGSTEEDLSPLTHCTLAVSKFIKDNATNWKLDVRRVGLSTETPMTSQPGQPAVGIRFGFRLTPKEELKAEAQYTGRRTQ